MKTIPLTKGQSAIVDDDDFDRINQWEWYAAYKDPRYKHLGFYAARSQRIGLRKENKKKTVFMHKMILTSEGNRIDHINGNGLDNTRSNLRICTNRENAHNGSGNVGLRKHSAFKGIKKHTNTWSARITVNGKNLYLGSFRTETEAAKAYNIAATQYFGTFAKLNEVDR